MVGQLLFVLGELMKPVDEMVVKLLSSTGFLWRKAHCFPAIVFLFFVLNPVM